MSFLWVRNLLSSRRKKYTANLCLIATDISMPVMSGIESTKRIRQFEREQGLPPVVLIALTGAANPDTRQEAFNSGVDIFLTKPVPMQTLRVILENLQKNRRHSLTEAEP
jgi:CheY-like chemotaxis protein